MTYEAPKLTVVGTVEGLTLGSDWTAINDDGTHWWPGQSDKGSR